MNAQASIVWPLEPRGTALTLRLVPKDAYADEFVMLLMQVHPDDRADVLAQLREVGERGARVSRQPACWLVLV